MKKQKAVTKFKLASPYGFLTPKFDKRHLVWNGRIGTVLDNSRVRFRGLRETVEVPLHWRAAAR